MEIFEAVGGALKELAGVPLTRLKDRNQSEWSLIERETDAKAARLVAKTLDILRDAAQAVDREGDRNGLTPGCAAEIRALLAEIQRSAAPLAG